MRPALFLSLRLFFNQKQGDEGKKLFQQKTLHSSQYLLLGIQILALFIVFQPLCPFCKLQVTDGDGNSVLFGRDLVDRQCGRIGFDTYLHFGLDAATFPKLSVLTKFSVPPVSINTGHNSPDECFQFLSLPPHLASPRPKLDHPDPFWVIWPFPQALEKPCELKPGDL